jgi:mannonate dehydratase
MNPRDLFRNLGLAGAGGRQPGSPASSAQYAQAVRGLPPLKITRVRAIQTRPQGARLTVVKVETSEPGLYGLGCATFDQRALPVAAAVDKYLDPFARGRDADNIEDIWQTATATAYWRNGPVLNNALSGLDQALWDIKGKRAGMPVYQLLGGKCRIAAECYTHASGRDFAEVAEDVRRHMEQGFRHVRIQLGGYGSPELAGEPDFRAAGFGRDKDRHKDPLQYLLAAPRMFEHVRVKCGDEVELLHDIHEQLHPRDAIRLLQALEPYRPYFVEDPVAPEDNGYFEQIRQQTNVPIAMGELFNNPNEWIDLIARRYIDFIRVHISQIGGLTVARKLAAFAEWFNVRTAWHGPLDVSPVGHAVNAHLDLAVPNFGIQECVRFGQATQDVFPGAPTVNNGYMQVNEAPGFGVDLDEKLAAKFPLSDAPGDWRPSRRRDGTSVRP